MPAPQPCRLALLAQLGVLTLIVRLMSYCTRKPKNRNQESQNSPLTLMDKSTTIWLWIDWVQHLLLCLIHPGGG